MIHPFSMYVFDAIVPVYNSIYNPIRDEPPRYVPEMEWVGLLHKIISQCLSLEHLGCAYVLTAWSARLHWLLRRTPPSGIDKTRRAEKLTCFAHFLQQRLDGRGGEEVGLQETKNSNGERTSWEDKERTETKKTTT